MRTWNGFACVGILLLVGCSSSTTGAASSSSGGGGGCADITGNYNVTPHTSATTCPPSADTEYSVTIAHNGTDLDVVLPGVTGGCAGTLDSATCRFEAQCLITANGATKITYNVDWTFAGKTLTGSIAAAAAAGIAGPNACTSTETDDGTRL